MVAPEPKRVPAVAAEYQRIVAPIDALAVSVPLPYPHRVIGTVEVTEGVEHSVLKVSSAVQTLRSVPAHFPRTHNQYDVLGNNPVKLTVVCPGPTEPVGVVAKTGAVAVVAK